MQDSTEWRFSALNFCPSADQTAPHCACAGVGLVVSVANMVTCRNRDRTGSEMEDDEKQAAALSQKIIALLKGSNVSQFVALWLSQRVRQLLDTLPLRHVRRQRKPALHPSRRSTVLPSRVSRSARCPVFRWRHCDTATQPSSAFSFWLFSRDRSAILTGCATENFHGYD